MVRHRLMAAVAAPAAVVGLVACGLATAGQKQHANARKPHAAVGRSTPVQSPSPTGSEPPPNMRLIFHQTFTAPLNTSVWGTCYPWASQSGCTNFSNPETEWYLPSQVQVRGGALHLIARRAVTQGTTRTGQSQQYECRSGMVTSYPGFRFQYGYVQVVAQLPTRRGLWSGLWLAAASLKWPPEIDILERWGPPKDKAGIYYHPVNAHYSYFHLDPAQRAATASGWHTYSVLWTPRRVTWYIDNQKVMVVNKGVPRQKMYVIADLANYTSVGGCSGQVAIRSIDVWQR